MFCFLFAVTDVIITVLKCIDEFETMIISPSALFAPKVEMKGFRVTILRVKYRLFNISMRLKGK